MTFCFGWGALRLAPCSTSSCPARVAVDRSGSRPQSFPLRRKWKLLLGCDCYMYIARSGSRYLRWPAEYRLRYRYISDEEDEDELDDEEDEDFDEEGDEEGEEEVKPVTDKAPPKKKLKTASVPAEVAPQKNGQNGHNGHNGKLAAPVEDQDGEGEGEGEEEEEEEDFDDDDDDADVPDDEEQGDEENEEDELPTKAVKISAAPAAPAAKVNGHALAVDDDDEED
ncbi:hypothetical protein B0T22DRAFT_132409 [Podospora appendiculata]|uniref:Uncharacterized protein n=1 Tax=Podospora appendiculata TaxID=314037 RepID=A0AAE0X8E9_9PEZI|nr:hypothetical protein B0T22DRAFT_132409 [Podospora appendiculata]